MVESPPDIDAALKALAWSQGRLEWKMHAAQRKIHAAVEALPVGIKHAVILCCRRFGKSYYGCARGLMNGLRRQRFLTRIIGPDIKQTVMIVEYNMAKLTEELAELGLRDLVRRVKSENMYHVGSSAIFLGGFDSQRDSLRGGEANEILVEETGASDAEQYSYMMRDVLKPQLLKTRGRMIDLTTLPSIPDHPFSLETIEQAKLDGAFYSYTIYEDPLATPEIIADAIKDCGGEDTDAFRREYLNLQTRNRSLVIIPDYCDTQDVEDIRAPLSSNLEIFTDWGGVRDFTVSLLMTYDFLRGCDYVLAELWWENNTPTDRIKLETAAAWGDLRARNWYADAHGQTVVDLNREEFETDLKRKLACDGLPRVRMPRKDDFESAINNMGNRFRVRKVKIHPSCALLRATCRSGVLNKQRTDFARSPTLGHMDAAAALMYGIRNLDRSNPYPEQAPSSDWLYTKPKAADSRQSLVQVPKSFGAKGGKRF